MSLFDLLNIKRCADLRPSSTPHPTPLLLGPTFVTDIGGNFLESNWYWCCWGWRLVCVLGLLFFICWPVMVQFGFKGLVRSSFSWLGFSWCFMVGFFMVLSWLGFHNWAWFSWLENWWIFVWILRKKWWKENSSWVLFFIYVLVSICLASFGFLFWFLIF